jgi:hypothetical protein
MAVFPRLARIRQAVPNAPLADVAQAVRDELHRIGITQQVKPGARIAVAAGSRGITDYAVVIGTIVDELKRIGAEPFIFPAMGSHGGATAEGQAGVLATWGITEETMGCPILSDMDVTYVGTTESGIPVYCDSNAFASDGIIVVNRVKIHTDFHGPTESGITKMMGIGLGKITGAEPIHKRGLHGLRYDLPQVAAVHLANSPILCGVAIIEDGAHHVSIIEAIPAQQIPTREPELLRKAYQLLARLPVHECDILICDLMGKDISGAGMDNNVLGRLRIDGEPDPESPKIGLVCVRRLTEATHGNAAGIGFGDLITQQLYDAIDHEVTRINVQTSGFLLRGIVPPVLPNDQAMIARALEIMAEQKPGITPRIIRIKSTLHLEELQVSENLLEELRDQPGIELIQEAQAMEFDAEGTLVSGNW